MRYTVADALNFAMGVRKPEDRERFGFVVLYDPAGSARACLSVGCSKQTMIARARRWTNNYVADETEVRYVPVERLDDDYNDVCHEVLADLYEHRPAT